MIDPSTTNQIIAGAATITAAGITGYATARYKTAKVERKLDGQGQLAIEILKLLRPNGGTRQSPTLYDQVQSLKDDSVKTRELAANASVKVEEALKQLGHHCRKIDYLKGDIKALADMLTEHDARENKRGTSPRVSGR